jgi:anthranilate synthase component 1
MVHPSIEEFKEKTKDYNIIPVYREILADLDTPVSAFRKINKSAYGFLLESVEGGEQLARYSFLGANPSVIFKSKGKQVTITRNNQIILEKESSNPLDELKSLLNKYKVYTDPALPRFFGGAVGYLSYDMVRFMEKLPDKNPDDLNLPDMYFMITDTILIFDHVLHKIKIISNAYVENGDADKAYQSALQKIESLVKDLNAPAPPLPETPEVKVTHELRSNFKKEEFEKAVEDSKEYIKAGDIFQVVLSQRFETEITSSPFDIYRALRSINPSPYMYYLQFEDATLVGSSPEILVRADEGKLQLRPIAGTRPRGKNQEEDEALIKDLLADPKERAEHLMLVDLGRNDLGRISEYGSVHVSDFMVIEKYSHVLHIVSNVEGTLAKGKDAFDVLNATFPAGTVSGAPKIRAMEIIDELEPTRRGPYAGTVGYFSFSGNLDACITLRTIVIKGNKAYIQAGAGLVADSVPSSEYQETVNKSKAMLKAIELAEAGLE